MGDLNGLFCLFKGGPLSPILFCIAGDFLSRLILQKVRNQELLSIYAKISFVGDYFLIEFLLKGLFADKEIFWLIGVIFINL